MITTATEEPIFQDASGIFVSQSRAVLRGTTFAMANITSVRAVEIKPNRAAPALFLLIALAIMTVSPGFGVFIAIITVIFLIAAKSKWEVVIGSASGEVRAFTSTDQAYIQSLVDAINHAIIARG